jgi:hypothetical protein
MSVAAQNDAELVSRSLSGNRDTFEQIVARYQSLICSLALVIWTGVLLAMTRPEAARTEPPFAKALQ